MQLSRRKEALYRFHDAYMPKLEKAMLGILITRAVLSSRASEGKRALKSKRQTLKAEITSFLCSSGMLK